MARKAQDTGGGPAVSEEDIADQLRPILHRLTRRLRWEAADEGVSSQDLLLLGIIKLRPGIGVSEIAGIEDTTPSTISAHIRRLRAVGWVTVDDSFSDDLRRSHLTLTKAGQEAMAKVRRRSNDWLGQKIEELPERERQKLAEALPAIAGLLKSRRKT